MDRSMPRRFALVIIALLVALLPLIAPFQPGAEAQQSGIVMRTVYVAMRDGIRLETNYWLPEGAGPWPVLMTRTPYGVPPTNSDVQHRWWASQGYAVVRQYFRGTMGSEGVYAGLWEHQVDDGYDGVEWAAAQSWSTGKVGLWGCSVPSLASQSAVAGAPPHLVTAWFQNGGMNGWGGFGYQGKGAYQNTHPGFYTGLALGFTAVFDPRPGDDNYEIRLRVAEQRRISQNRALMNRTFPYEMDPLNRVFDNSSNSQYWQDRSWQRYASQIRIPTVHTAQWSDPYVEESLKTATEYPGIKRTIVADGLHCVADYRPQMLRWFDYWLKGVENGVMSDPPVAIQVLGDNRWRGEQSWPLTRARNTPLYFRAGRSGTADSLNDGRASWEMPMGLESPDPIAWDPNRPRLPGFSRIASNVGGDQRPEEVQILTFTSDILTEDVEITGPVTAVIWATSTASDALWSVTLTEVLPDGTSDERTRGSGRANLRVDESRITPVVPGEVYRLEFPLNPISRVFKAGNRIRIGIANADFPRFGLVLQPSNNALYHDVVHASHIVLPIVPPGGEWLPASPPMLMPR